jgi:hypothetical protein
MSNFTTVYPTFNPEDKNLVRKLNQLTQILQQRDGLAATVPFGLNYNIQSATGFTANRTLTATSTATQVRAFVLTLASDLHKTGYLG